jgi:hypothetical protein
MLPSNSASAPIGTRERDAIVTLPSTRRDRDRMCDLHFAGLCAEKLSHFNATIRARGWQPLAAAARKCGGKMPRALTNGKADADKFTPAGKLINASHRCISAA